MLSTGRMVIGLALVALTTMLPLRAEQMKAPEEEYGLLQYPGWRLRTSSDLKESRWKNDELGEIAYHYEGGKFPVPVTIYPAPRVVYNCGVEGVSLSDFAERELQDERKHLRDSMASITQLSEQPVSLLSNEDAIRVVRRHEFVSRIQVLYFLNAKDRPVTFITYSYSPHEPVDLAMMEREIRARIYAPK